MGCMLRGPGVSASFPSLEVKVESPSLRAHQPRYFLLPAGLSQSSVSFSLEVGSLEEGVDGGVLDCVVLGVESVCYQRDYRGPQWLSER